MADRQAAAKPGPTPDRPMPHAGYQETPTQHTKRGDVLIDGGRIADNLTSLREWYELRGVRSFVSRETTN